MTLASDARNWRKIRDAWVLYCTKGAGEGFDWDYDSRDIMADLTGHDAFEYLSTPAQASPAASDGHVQDGESAAR